MARSRVSGFEGTGSLLRLALRRDRVLLPAWTGVFLLTASGSAGATVGLYPTIASRVQASDAINNTPALVALYGRVLDPTSLGALCTVKMVSFGAAMVALFTIIVTVRHSRAEEETGRSELLGATVVGRRAPLTAALLVATIASVLVGVASAIGLVGAGLPAAGSFAFGAAWAGVGIAFAGVAAVAAQVARAARNATGLSVGFLALAYVVRAAGDANEHLHALTWISPLGWGHRMAAFSANRWPVLLLFGAFAAATVLVAYELGARRDVGAGMFADRRGPPRAAPLLRSGLGLAWRLERGALFAWTAGFAFGGALLGSIAGEVGSITGSKASRQYIQRLGGQHSLTNAYLAAVLGILGLIAAAYGVRAASRIRSDEIAGRAEAELATGVGRVRWATGYLIVAVAGTTVLALTAGIAAGVARGIQTHHVHDAFGVVGGALVQLPAVWVVVGILVAAYGVGARYAIAGWFALTIFFVLGEIGAVFNLPRRVLDVSPFAHVPHLPGSALDVAPLAVLLAIAAMLAAVGLVGVQRRDIGS